MNERITKTKPYAALYRGRSDVDGLLCDYFQSEMPDPWPSAPATTKKTLPQPEQADGWWRRSRARLALAAAIALFFVGYGALSWAFPNLALTGSQRLHSPFGKKIEFDETENGAPVRIEVINDGKKISIGVQPIGKNSP